ncbi:unnamed protein product [Adineta steineri]|uniref:Uncharacterized protein n=1 Tax=Adineta steineri TaxID=433720 RepID=A0A818Y4F7_9BILA|nr:unnamed protein product [Adineta steineri]
MYLKNNQLILISGGTAVGSITDYYNNKTHLNNAIAKRAHHQATYILQLNAVLITGRNNHTHVEATMINNGAPNTATVSVERYNYTTGKFNIVANMKDERYYHNG